MLKKSKQSLEEKIDKLFDLSACSCSLEVVHCNNSRIKCKILSCIQNHIMCSCSPKSKEQEYLRDQRLKEGAKRLYQIGLVDKFAAARDQKRSKQHLNFFS